MEAFRHLRHQRKRLSAIRRSAIVFDRRDIVAMAEYYSARLTVYAKRYRPGDAGRIMGMLGPNGIGPAIDDLAKSIRWERHKARRIAMNLAFRSGTTPAGEGLDTASPSSPSNFRKVA